MASLKSELEAKITSLRNEYEAAEKHWEKQTQLQTALLHKRLEDLKKLEQELVVGIRKVPNEILVEILKHSLGDNLPCRRLASVCKRWKALLQHTPSFWRNLQVSIVGAETAEHEAAVLQRRIELSDSTLLDVTLYTYHLPYGKSNRDLLNLISNTGLERWRSLKIYSCSSQTIDKSLEGIFASKLSALRSLECVNHGSLTTVMGPFIPIYQLIIQSNPPIKQLTINGPNPSLFQGSPIFRQLHELNASATAVSQLMPLPNLKTLKINGSLDGRDFSSPAW
jgi:hypothetical protein